MINIGLLDSLYELYCITENSDIVKFRYTRYGEYMAVTNSDTLVTVYTGKSEAVDGCTHRLPF
jgi:hypothetical protein